MAITPLHIRGHLDGLGITYRHVTHGPTRTSQESAAARGEPLENGAKALVLKVDDAFRLIVLSAANKLDSGSVKRRFGAKSVRFASAAELGELTGLVPGSVPPFGRPLLPLDLYVDRGIERLTTVAFNAASLTESIAMRREDYLRAAAPVEIGSFGAAG